MAIENFWCGHWDMKWEKRVRWVEKRPAGAAMARSQLKKKSRRTTGGRWHMYPLSRILGTTGCVGEVGQICIPLQDWIFPLFTIWLRVILLHWAVWRKGKGLQSEPLMGEGDHAASATMHAQLHHSCKNSGTLPRLVRCLSRSGTLVNKAATLL